MSARPPLPTVRVRLDRKHDFWGNPFEWAYPRHVLKSALEKVAGRPDGFIARSVRMIAGPSMPIRSILLEHFQEGAVQIVFRTTVLLEKGRVVLATALSKEEGSFTRIAMGELNNLRHLHRVCAEHVVQPFEGDFVELLLPTGRRRRLYGYCTLWLPDFHELGVNRRMNFYINELPIHNFDRGKTQWLKGEMLRILMDLYDRRSQCAVEPPLVGAGDFVVTRPRRGEPLRLKLIAARKLVRGISEEEALQLYRDYEGDWGGKIFRFV